jgi:hypothetical protein
MNGETKSFGHGICGHKQSGNVESGKMSRSLYTRIPTRLVVLSLLLILEQILEC